MTPQLFLLLCLPAVYESALPPGYQDRLFCPDKYCLGRKHPGAGMVGPKTLLWECRWGTGSALESIKFKPVPVLPWGSKMIDAELILQQHKDKLMHERHCEFLHSKPVDGVYTVTVDEEDDENSQHESYMLGESSGPSITTVIMTAMSVVCFILFCCVSSAMSAASHYPDESGTTEMTSSRVDGNDFESTIDIDKIR